MNFTDRVWVLVIFTTILSIPGELLYLGIKRKQKSCTKYERRHCERSRIYLVILSLVMVAAMVCFLFDLERYLHSYDWTVPLFSGISVLTLTEISKSDDKYNFFRKMFLGGVFIVILLFLEQFFCYIGLKNPYHGLLEGMVVWLISIVVEEKVK